CHFVCYRPGPHPRQAPPPDARDVREFVGGHVQVYQRGHVLRAAGGGRGHGLHGGQAGFWTAAQCISAAAHAVWGAHRLHITGAGAGGAAHAYS
nr:hypothetical protein [Tanacetum cinerariifolium]